MSTQCLSKAKLVVTSVRFASLLLLGTPQPPRCSCYRSCYCWPCMSWRGNSEFLKRRATFRWY